MISGPPSATSREGARAESATGKAAAPAAGAGGRGGRGSRGGGGRGVQDIPHEATQYGGMIGDTTNVPFGTTFLFTVSFNGGIAPRPLVILYTNSLSAVEEWVGARLSETPLCFGVDTESKPRFDPGVPQEEPKVLQIATETHAVVFQMNAAAENLALASELAPRLFALLYPHRVAPAESSSSPPSLIGMSLLNDLIELEPVFGCVQEIKLKAARRAYSHVIELDLLRLGGLLALAQSTTSVVKWKSNRLQMSKWQEYPHNRARVVYAAMDAWAAAAIYGHFHKNPPFPKPPPKPPKDNDNEARKSQRSSMLKRKLCFPFQEGKCDFGDRCHYVHELFSIDDATAHDDA